MVLNPSLALFPSPAFHWHPIWRNVKIELTDDRLEATWYKGKVHNYWATFAGDKLFEGGQHYVEIEVVDLGRPRPSKKLAIGVIGCTKAKAKNCPWADGKYSIGQWKEVPSWAFHPISGYINSSSLPVDGKPYSKFQLQNGDRIGMLVDIEERTLNFFCNGQDLGVAFTDIDASLLPAVSIRDKIHVRLRFPPPPYSKRKSKLIHLSSCSHLKT